MLNKVWYKIIYPSPNFNGYSRLSLCIDKWLHITLYNECKYLSMRGLKLSHISKGVPGDILYN